MARAFGVKELYGKKFDTWEIPKEWMDSIGRVATNFSMIVWGRSANGKTRFVLALCKVLTEFGKVAFDCLEEGVSLTMQEAFRANNMEEVAGKIILIDRENYDELVKRLSRKKSPNIVVINSIQHMRMTYEQWIELRKKFKKKCFILISHADGKDPSGASAKSIRYDCDIKTEVSEFVAYSASRYGGNNPFIIWKERAVIRNQWKKHFKKNLVKGDQMPIFTNN